MKRPRKVPFRFAVLCFLMTFPLCIPLTFAQGNSGGNGQNMKDAAANVLAKTDTLTTTLQDMCNLNCQSTPAGKMFKKKTDQLKAAQNRAKNANSRMSANDFQKLNRKHSKKASDGCDAEVQICVQNQTGTVTASGNNEPEVDEQTGADVVSNLNDVASDVDQLNQILSGNGPPTPPTVYADLENAEYFFPNSMWPSPTVAYAAFIANLAAEKVADLARPACDETLVALGEGGNGALACEVTEGIYMVLNYTEELMEYIVRERADSEITGTYERVGDVYYQLLGTGGDLNAVKQEVIAMGKELLILEKNQEYMMQLLTTPQGRRPGFPTGGGSSGAGSAGSAAKKKGQ